MSDFVRPAIDNVVIVLEPGNHEEVVSPRLAAHIGRLQRENAKERGRVEGKWISVEDQRPLGDYRILFTTGHETCLGYYRRNLDQWWRDGPREAIVAGVTYWMVIPAVPVARELPESPK